MKTRTDRCIEDLAQWFVEHGRAMTKRDMRPIVKGHFPEEADQVTFYEYLASEQGQAQFGRALRQAARKETKDDAGTQETPEGDAG